MHKYRFMHVCLHPSTHTYIQIHAYLATYINNYACLLTFILIDTYTHTLRHLCLHTCIHTYSHMSACINIHLHSYIHINTCNSYGGYIYITTELFNQLSDWPIVSENLVILQEAKHRKNHFQCTQFVGSQHNIIKYHYYHIHHDNIAFTIKHQDYTKIAI